MFYVSKTILKASCIISIHLYLRFFYHIFVFVSFQSFFLLRYVCPQCCTVEPRETKRIQFEFKPLDSYVKLMDDDVLLGKVELTEDGAAPEAENEEVMIKE